MLDDYFQLLKLNISWEEFRALPRHPAYRYEYRNEEAVLSGRPRYYHCLLPLTEQTAPVPEPAGSSLSCFFSNYDRRRIHESDWSNLPPLFAKAFQHGAPLGILSEEQRLAAAGELLERTRTGLDGPVVPEASWIFEDRTTGELLACLIVTLIPSGNVEDFTEAAWSQSPPPDALQTGWGQPHLTWIFVSPNHQRRHLGILLLRETVVALQRRSYPQLVSTILLGDVTSLLWHWHCGFQLVSHPGSRQHWSS